MKVASTVKSVVIAFLACLLVFPAEGLLAPRITCNCMDAGLDSINFRFMASYKVYPKSNTCPRLEIVVTLKKRGNKRCVNPESRLGKTLIKKAIRMYEKKNVVNATPAYTASAHTVNSTSVNTTSTL